jgi:hypothetical protein
VELIAKQTQAGDPHQRRIGPAPRGVIHERHGVEDGQHFRAIVDAGAVEEAR